ncbi:hypothetical protein F5882DRAFT_466253 [Hyaloscypha sp. PMI_1271]|nr:hypothetical protein F5882DRAFT_466253 [Hyaloscypha sp. PMI_1271]
MQEMTTMHTQTAEPGTELRALPLAGESMLKGSSAANRSSVPEESTASRRSLSDSNDPEICTAAIRTIPRSSTSDRMRLRVQDIRSNKIARRTLQAMVIIGAITLLYQFVSLFPAFQGAFATSRGLEVQIQGEADTRQGLAYAFLSECANRKNQNLLLGPDCEKYLTKSPKAPPDIDKWMTNADISGVGLTNRGIVFSTSQLVTAASAILQRPAPRTALMYAVFASGACSVLLLLSAFKYGVVCSVAGILMSPVFALFFLSMSRVSAITVGWSIFLFAMTSSIVFKGRIRAVFVCTIGYATICVVLARNMKQNLRGP